MRRSLFIIAISSLSLSQLHAQILLDDVMSKDDQKKSGVANLSLKQKVYLENWINKTFVLKTEQICPDAPAKMEAESPLTLSINIDNGQKLELSDNSMWEVDPKDLATSAIWIIPFPIKVTPNNDPNYPFTLTNINTGASVKARKATPAQ